MNTISTGTHIFHREKVAGDGSCLYTSVRYVMGISLSMDNKRLRSLVAERISKNPNIREIVTNSGTNCRNVEEYCSQITKGNLWGGEPELRALALLCRTLIRLVSKTKSTEGRTNINILNYGEDDLSLTECVYIVYDEQYKHFDPLYMINEQNPTERRTIFPRDDAITDNLIHKFIQDELQGPKETDEVDDLVLPNLPNKRKTAKYDGIDDIVFGKYNNRQLPLLISNESFDLHKPTKCSELDINSISPIIQLLQTDHFPERSVEDLPVVSKDEDKMKFEFEPALRFRGRTRREFKPKKALKRNGKPSEPGSPRYFGDRQRHHFLNLLIPKNYFSLDADHCLKVYIVTQEIRGCTYVHPYFKFQVHPTDKNIPDENPIYITLDETKLKDYSKGEKQLKLQLVVVMHTRSDLMQSNQPLEIFSSLNTGSRIQTKFETPTAFVNAYHLRNLRFAVNLCSKQPGETEFRQYNDKGYISEVSTEDKRTRVRTNTNS